MMKWRWKRRITAATGSRFIRDNLLHHSQGMIIMLVMQNRTVKALTSKFKLMVIEPKGFDECSKLVDSLKSRKPIIVNLEKLDSDTARRFSTSWEELHMLSTETCRRLPTISSYSLRKTYR